MTDERVGGSPHPREFPSNPSLSFLPVTMLSLAGVFRSCRAEAWAKGSLLKKTLEPP